ncbi:polymorphic toxin type 15 domain-containing protein [Pseudomonas syringae pv. actinidifoliorum]|nr:polymorphic toxin type 15 domain-containing protein [Pseudomonas syringae pv. actinidifoliorum]MDU8523844.1 polymorphic toxin type 15 domain-containing protein [Pseudomonas syringae pv. actinidifoliorum]MDU8529330.1 polymorphic toxin type 15 domain-containing protein [Pseudomonas syringae pv. actinidifoliorum]
MPLWSIVPTWFDIERRFSRSMGYQPGASFQRSPNNEPVSTLQLNLRRISNIRTAFIRAEWQAARRLGRRFADIDIASIINDLIDVVSQMAMIVAGSTLVGGAIGAGIGFGFFGIGALPSGAAGAAIGLEVSTWILAILGLASIAEFFVDGLPQIFDHYVRGIKVAWEGTRGEPGLNPFGGDDPQVVDRAAYHIAQGHEEVVVLLLGAIVAYLTRGRGNASVLASEMQASSKGAKLGQWMLEHEEALKRHPDLQNAGPRRGALDKQEPPPPPPPPNRRADEPEPKKPLGMAEHEVPCFRLSEKHRNLAKEFDDQLEAQQNGLNDLTVDEYLKGRKAFTDGDVVRDPKVARDARRAFSLDMESKFRNQLRLEGRPPSEAAALAKKMTSEKMATLAALHNPDLFAGGKDIIGDFGDRRINSSIGSQWPSRISGLDTAASNIPDINRETTKVNAKLKKC